MDPTDIEHRKKELVIIQTAYDALMELDSEYLTKYPINFVVKTHPDIIEKLETDKIKKDNEKTMRKNEIK